MPTAAISGRSDWSGTIIPQSAMRRASSRHAEDMVNVKLNMQKL
jgi:hypothetical protein